MVRLAELLERLATVAGQFGKLAPAKQDYHGEDHPVPVPENVGNHSEASPAYGLFVILPTASPTVPGYWSWPVLECVINVSEGRDAAKVAAMAAACGQCLLDVHSDPDHNRSVLTVAGRGAEVQTAARRLAGKAVELIDLRAHGGVHPRTGALDVVPWVALEGWPLVDATSAAGRRVARLARDSFARWAAAELGLPIFLYGPERSLPELRRSAWRTLAPDLGPARAHPTAGAAAVGYRPLMVAYNLWLAEGELATARAIAARIRSPQVRALGFAVGGGAQVSCNLLAPLVAGPAWAWDEVSRWAAVVRAELVGLVPEMVLRSVPEQRWGQLDLAPERTIEHRLAEAGLQGLGGDPPK